MNTAPDRGLRLLKAGIFLDVENLVRCGGWGIRYRRVRELVEAQDAVVLRANAYVAVDKVREEKDPEYRRKKREYRDAARREGFHLVPKEVQRYTDVEGITITKANADLDLAVDAMLQSENLDYVLLGSGDGDFLRLVRALQARGKRVDLLAFSNVSGDLRREVDFYFSGYLVPGILPTGKENPSRSRGVVRMLSEEKGFGFITIMTGLRVTDSRDDIFLHIRDCRSADGRMMSSGQFASLRERKAILEFELVEQPDGKVRAANVTELAEPRL